MIINFLKLIRYPNLIIMVISQMAGFVLMEKYFSLNGFSGDFFLLVAGTVFIAAAGNIFNDIKGIKTDLINKPDKVFAGKYFNKNKLSVLCYLLELSALILGLLVNTAVFFSFLICILLLRLYSAFINKIPLFGNLIIASLMAFNLLVVSFLPEMNTNFWIYFYAFFAFLTGFLRELTKDAEDIEGDRQTALKTFPVKFGLGATNNFLRILLLILLFSVLLLVAFSFNKGQLLNPVFLLAGCVLPLMILMIKSGSFFRNRSYRIVSLFLKIVMVGGIFSMFFIKT